MKNKKDTEQMIYTRAFQNIRARLSSALDLMAQGKIAEGIRIVKEIQIYAKQYESIAREYED